MPKRGTLLTPPHTPDPSSAAVVAPFAPPLPFLVGKISLSGAYKESVCGAVEAPTLPFGRTVARRVRRPGNPPFGSKSSSWTKRIAMP